MLERFEQERARYKAREGGSIFVWVMGAIFGVVVGGLTAIEAGAQRDVAVAEAERAVVQAEFGAELATRCLESRMVEVERKRKLREVGR